MPVERQDIVEAALTEWEHWGRQAWNLATGAKRFGTRDDELPRSDGPPLSCGLPRGC